MEFLSKLSGVLGLLVTIVTSVSALILAFAKVIKPLRDFGSDVKDLKVSQAENSERISNLTTELCAIKKEFVKVAADLDEHMIAQELDMVRGARQRILKFNAELLEGKNPPIEYFDEILADIDAYERYCDEHKEYPNNKARLSIKNIKDNYPMS